MCIWPPECGHINRRNDMRAHDIPMAADGMPLERYMRRAYPLCDAAMLRRALAHRDFKQDGTRLNGSARVRGGAHIECFMADEYLLGAPLEVLCREERLAAVIKPAGLTCQRDAQGVGEDTLESRVREMFGEAYLVNRLDHFTGGVMPIALDAAMRDAMTEAFAAHQVEKVYVCQVTGAPKAAGERLVHYAIKSAENSMVRVFDAPRPGALTMALSYEVIERGEVSRLRVHLETGRTHQIRAQLAHVGLPVLGDDKYGDRSANKAHGAAYQRLWCESVRFTSGICAGREFSSPAVF